jgi:signal transduction histidine kinase
MSGMAQDDHSSRDAALPDPGRGEARPAIPSDTLKWLAAGLAITAGILYFGYISHQKYRDTLTHNYKEQQGMFALSLASVISDHLLEEEQDLLFLVKTIQEGGDLDAAASILPYLYNTHLDDFESVGLFDAGGEPVFTVPSKGKRNRDLYDAVRDAIRKHEGHAAATFLSERLISPRNSTSVLMFLPFRHLNESWRNYYAVGALKVDDYVVSHFPSWKGRSMGFILADDDGEILSMLNTRHETDVTMRGGKLFSLADDCLECHVENAFDDIRRATTRDIAVHSIYRKPLNGAETTRTTVSFPIFNERWTITIISPFANIQQSIDENFMLNVALTLLALFLVITLSCVVIRSIRLEESAREAAALQLKEESLKRHSHQLEEANKLKNLFTDIVRHDLMSPVTIARGYIDILSHDEKDPARRETFSTIHRSLRRLSDLIQDSSTISKLEEIENLQVSQLDLGDLVRASIDTLGRAIREKELELVGPAGGRYPIVGNPILEDAISNLVSNAIKYGSEGKKVEVGIADSGQNWQVSVKDWGEGIPEEARGRIFNRLERLGKEGIKGSGLGLAIVKLIASLHGGSVRMDENPEGGSIFTITLPKGGPETRR